MSPAVAPGDAKSLVAKKPHAVILAAGIGRRLGLAQTDGSPAPKVLLDVGGTSLLARHLGHLAAAGVREVTIVVGYGATEIRAALAQAGANVTVRTIENPDFREGSVVSLWAARDVLRCGEPILLMDADVIYDSRLLGLLLDSRHGNCFLLDRVMDAGDEPVKLCIRAGAIVDFRKLPTEAHDWHGESVGFFRFSPDVASELARRAEDYVAGGRRHMEYEEPIRDMVMAGSADRFGFEDVSGLPWTEIDFPEDVQKARALLPALAA